MAENSSDLPGLNLLSFDGGGITGLSSLLALREIMNRLQAKSGSTTKLNPWEHFDLIAGVGTGAICAVMLGRLKLSMDDAIAAYVYLVSEVFRDKKLLVHGGSGAFRATKLEQGLKEIVKKATGDAEERMMEENPSETKCKVVVYAMSAHNMNASLPCAFRTYPAGANAMPDCQIWKALRASTAHPDLFKSIEIEELGLGQHYVGGGLGCGNPTVQMLKEVATLYPDRSVASIISLGAGHVRTIQIPQLSRLKRLLPGTLVTSHALRAAYGIATDNERAADDMATRFSDAPGIYYRLNVDQGVQSVDPTDWEKQSEVAGHTGAYMQKAETDNLVNALVDGLSRRQAGVPIAQIDGRVKISSRNYCPPPTSLFAGRVTEIDIVNQYFGNQSQAQQIFVLYGLGGAGKTQTALKSAEVMAQRFEGVIFIDGSSRENIETALSGFALAKRIGTAYTDTLSWLGSRKARWLMLFDNVDDPNVRVHEYFPRSSRYSILITTRHQDIVRLSIGKDSHCNLAELHPKEARKLLFEAAGMKEDRLDDKDIAAATGLLKEFGHLALAIVQCGAYIWRAKCTISQYYNMYLAERQATLEGNFSQPLRLQDYDKSVYTTWTLSYVRVGQLSKKLLALSAFLHRDTISEEIFRRASMNAPKYRPEVPPTKHEARVQIEVEAILKLFTNDKGQWSSRLFLSATSELVCLSLVTFDTSNNLYHLHPLVQQWARTMASEIQYTYEHTAFLLALAIDREKRSEDHAFRRAMGPHVSEVMELCKTVNSNNAWQFIAVYDEVRQLDKLEELELQVLETRTSALGHEHPDTLESKRYVAGTHLLRGRLNDAENLFTQILGVRRRVLGDDNPDTLESMVQLAATYHAQHRLIEAEGLNLEALAAQKRVLGCDSLDTLRSIASLAATYLQQGRLSEAESFLTEVLAARKRILGADHPDSLNSMSHLAIIYHQQGRLREAEVLHVEVLAAHKRILGVENRLTLLSMANLAATYHELGRLADAEALFVELLPVQRRVLGDDHRDTVQVMDNLAQTYLAQGRQAEYQTLRLALDAIETA